MEPSTTKADMAYGILKERILSRQLLPGDRIVVSRICEELGVSVIPIREAVFRLESERLVKIKPFAGAVVTSGNEEEILGIMENTAVLEGYATRLAHPASEELTERLVHANNQMKQAVREEDWSRYGTTNKAFHMAIYEASANKSIIENLRLLWNQFSSLSPRSLFYSMPQRTRESVREHDEIIRLLSNPVADLLELELSARNHKLRTLKYYLSEELTAGRSTGR